MTSSCNPYVPVPSFKPVRTSWNDIHKKSVNINVLWQQFCGYCLLWVHCGHSMAYIKGFKKALSPVSIQRLSFQVWYSHYKDKTVGSWDRLMTILGIHILVVLHFTLTRPAGLVYAWYFFWFKIEFILRTSIFPTRLNVTPRVIDHLIWHSIATKRSVGVFLWDGGHVIFVFGA